VEGVSSKPKRSVWRVTTERGAFALKALRMPGRRVRFVTLAQAYLRGRCDLVPALLRAEVIRCWGADQGHLAIVLGSRVERQPLDAGCLKVLRADLTFPHSVYRAARDYFLGQRSWPPGDRRAEKLRLLLAVELSKPAVLEALRLEEELP
jgi:hypothetical protein